MFLLIPTQIQKQTGIQGIKSRMGFEPGSLKNKGQRRHSEAAISTENLNAPDSKNFSRHLSQGKPTYDHSETGFLWSWNFMLSKRWKMTSNTAATGDIAFMDKMLADFRKFCQNDRGRLVQFWRQCVETKKTTEKAEMADKTEMSVVESAIEAVDNANLSDQ